MIGYHMLQGESSQLQSSENGGNDISVSPLAVPLLAGPGTIATAMNYSAVGGISDFVTTVLAFLVLVMITYVCFMFSTKIISVIGASGLSIVTRLMGLILSVIGVQMVIFGVTSIIKHMNSSVFF